MPNTQLLFPTSSPVLHPPGQTPCPCCLSSVPTQRAERPPYDLPLLHASGFCFTSLFFLLAATLHQRTARAYVCISFETQPCARCLALPRNKLALNVPLPPCVHPSSTGVCQAHESAPLCPICYLLVLTFYLGPRFVPLTGSFIESQGILNSSNTDGREFKNRWDEWVWEVERDEEKPDEDLVWELHFARSWGRKNAFPPATACHPGHRPQPALSG